MGPFEFFASRNVDELMTSYFGASSDVSFTMTTPNSLQSYSTDSRAIELTSVSALQDEFIYYAYPASYGDLTAIIMDDAQLTNDATSIIGAFTKVHDTIQLTVNGDVIDYKVYRSNADNAFTDSKLKFV